MVTRDGRIYSEISKRFLKPYPNSSGYLLIDLHDPISKTSKTYQVHRLVAKAYIPNDDLDRDYVNHKNGDKTDNDVSNLEWVTHKENIEDRSV